MTDGPHNSNGVVFLLYRRPVNLLSIPFLIGMFSASGFFPHAC